MGASDARPRLRERLAAYAHEAWREWMRHMIDKAVMVDAAPGDVPVQVAWSSADWERWRRQIGTDYDGLPEKEKASDRAQADKILGAARELLVEDGGFGDLPDGPEGDKERFDRLDAKATHLSILARHVRAQAHRACPTCHGAGGDYHPEEECPTCGLSVLDSADIEDD